MTYISVRKKKKKTGKWQIMEILNALFVLTPNLLVLTRHIICIMCEKSVLMQTTDFLAAHDYLSHFMQKHSDLLCDAAFYHPCAVYDGLICFATAL